MILLVSDGHSGCTIDAITSGTGKVVVHLGGELDAESAQDARTRLLGLIEPGCDLVVDLAELEFVDSSGLGVLVLALTKTRDAAGRLVVVNPSPRIHRLMETSKVASLFGLDEPAPADVGTAVPAAEAAGRQVRDPVLLEDLRALLTGFENLLRWGDLRPEQVTLALVGAGLADEVDDLALAARVRTTLQKLGVAPAPPSSDDD